MFGTQLYAFIIVYIIIIGIIPYTLFNYAPFSLFLTYFANVDMISNILSIHFPDVFRSLYNDDYTTLFEYVSFNAINLVALSGIFIHGLHNKIKDKTRVLISMIIMSIITWTIPTSALPWINKKVEEYMKTHHIHLSHTVYKEVLTGLSILAGVAFIGVEWALIHYLIE